MNTRSISIILLVLALGGWLTGCKKEMKIYLPENTDLNGKAFVKVYNATLNATRNYVYIDNTPITGAGLAYGGLFPSVSYYAAIDPGNKAVNIRDTLVTSTQKPVTFNSTFEAGMNYTIFTYDTLTATKQLVVKDNIKVPTDTTARIRFANLIYSRVAVPNVDIYSVKQKANVFTNVSPASVTDFVPMASDVSDTLIVRSTGTTTALTQLNAILPREKRHYTVVFRGVYQLTSGTNTRALVSFTTY